MKINVQYTPSEACHKLRLSLADSLYTSVDNVNVTIVEPPAPNAQPMPKEFNLYTLTKHIKQNYKSDSKIAAIRHLREAAREAGFNIPLGESKWLVEEFCGL